MCGCGSMFALLWDVAKQESPTHWWIPGSRGPETSWNVDCSKNVGGCHVDRELPPDVSTFSNSFSNSLQHSENS